MFLPAEINFEIVLSNNWKTLKKKQESGQDIPFDKSYSACQREREGVPAPQIRFYLHKQFCEIVFIEGGEGVSNVDT